MPLAWGDIEQVQGLTGVRVRTEADGLDRIGHFCQKQRHIVHATQVEAVSRVERLERSSIPTEEMTFVGRRRHRVDHDLAELDHQSAAR